MADICARLAAAFKISEPKPETWKRQPQRPESVASLPSLGIEIEVPFSSYFPQLWSDYRLGERGIRGLEAHELVALSRDCTEQEGELRAKLALTVAAGIPRGGDRYWEFSLPPAHDVRLIVEAVRLLTAGGVLPRERRHSLHVTIAGMRSCRDAYALLGVLEARHVEPERLTFGLLQTRQAIHTGWARKGRSGIKDKAAAELVGGACCAVELRTLQLPVDDRELFEVLTFTQGCAHAIAVGESSPWWARWQRDRDAFRRELRGLGLPDANWWTCGPAGGVDLQAWSRFIEALPEIRARLVDEEEWALAESEPGPRA